MLRLIEREREREREEMKNWVEMLPDMLYMICERVSSFKDLVAFGGVCSTWRHVALKQNLGQPLLPFPWLMLAENPNDDHRDFYSVTEGKTYTFELPELRGKKCMETKGWIVTASDEGDMALVQPMTRVKIPLPHQNTSEIYDEHWMEPLFFVIRVVLSSPPKTKNDRDWVVMILHGDIGHVGFCRPGDKVWTVVESNFHGGTQSVEYYRGKFYVVINMGEVWEYDVIGKFNDTSSISSKRIEVNFLPLLSCRESYIVESAGSLLVVIRNGINVGDDGRYGTTECWVIEIDVEQGGYKEVRSLETRSIFLGYNATLSFDTILYPELIPNSIYFTDDCYELYCKEEPEGGDMNVDTTCYPELIPNSRDDFYDSHREGGGMNMGVYNLTDKNVQPHYSGKSLSFICPPVWTFLTTR